MLVGSVAGGSLPIQRHSSRKAARWWEYTRCAVGLADVAGDATLLQLISQLLAAIAHSLCFWVK